jgi:hypothetical protein
MLGGSTKNSEYIRPMRLSLDADGRSRFISKMSKLHYCGWIALCTGMAVLLLTGCAGTSIQYPPFPDQTKTVEDPAKARVYLIRPPGAINNHAKFVFYGTGPAATGPKVDPLQWLQPFPLFGIYPQNPTPDSPWRIIGEIAAGSYICWEEPPRVLELRDTGSINLTAGNVFYLRVRTPAFSTLKLDVINEEEGQALLKKCQPPGGYDAENPE